MFTKVLRATIYVKIIVGSMKKTHFNINDELKACEIYFKVIVKDKQ